MDSFDDIQVLTSLRKAEAIRKQKAREQKKRKEVSLRRKALPQRDSQVLDRAVALEKEGYVWLKGRPRPDERSLLLQLITETGLSRSHLHRILTKRNRSGRPTKAKGKSISQSVPQSQIQGIRNTGDLMAILMSQNGKDAHQPPPQASLSMGHKIATEVELHKAVDAMTVSELAHLHEHVAGALSRRTGSSTRPRPPSPHPIVPTVPPLEASRDALLEALAGYGSLRPTIDITAFVRWVETRK